MTLEDFFTLTEIKDGLTVTSRVEELVSLMQSNKDSILKNAGDASRQWAAVASTIAATKNRECLDVFVNLDGLHYLSSWLAEAQMLASNSIDRSLEESILALLEALENLGVDSSKLVSSGVWVAVNKLADHGSSRVRDQARKLFGGWNWKDNDHSESCSKIREDEMRVVAESRESCGQKSAVTLCSRQSNNENQGDEALLSEENNLGQDKGLELQNDKVGFESAVNSHYSNAMTETMNNSSSDDIMKEVEDILSVKEQSSTIGPSKKFGNMPISSDGLLFSGVEGPSNAPMGTEISREKQVAINRNLGGAVAVTSFDSNIVSIELEKNSLLQSSLDSNEVSRNASETCGSHDVSITHNSRHGPSLTHVIDYQDSDNSSSGHGRHRKVESVNADNEGKKDGKGHSKRKKRRNCRSSRPMTISQCLGAMDRTTTDIELGIVDALDIATKVAQEVAREVDSEERSRSSSEELSEGSQQFSGSQDFGDDDLHTESPSKGLSNHSFEKVHAGDYDVMERNNKPEDGTMKSDDVEDSQLAAAAKSEVGREKSPCDFDLNQDFCLDETDVIVSSIPTTTTTTTTSSTPIISVSHSIPAAAPFQLERSLSAKGSAVSVDLREKQAICRGIDLNVAELGDEQVEDVTPWKQYPLSESGRFNLDLNCKNEDDDVPPPTFDLKMETRLFPSHNGQENASSAAPFSFGQQAGKEVKLDLNDRPQFLIDEPVISILGTKVDVDRKDSLGLYMGRRGNSLSPPIYGYNGWSGPPALSMSSPMYVPGYMMDSRGTPVMMPQLMGPFPPQDLFVQPNLDQSSGFGVEVGNRESVKLRQFLTPEHSSRGMGEHSGTNVENPSSSSSIRNGGKRKEPETRWEWEFPPWR